MAPTRHRGKLNLFFLHGLSPVRCAKPDIMPQILRPWCPTPQKSTGKSMRPCKA